MLTPLVYPTNFRCYYSIPPFCILIFIGGPVLAKKSNRFKVDPLCSSSYSSTTITSNSHGVPYSTPVRDTQPVTYDIVTSDDNVEVQYKTDTSDDGVNQNINLKINVQACLDLCTP